MSSRDQAAAAALAQAAVACDGAFLGIAIAVLAVRTWLRFRFSSSALSKIRNAPTVRVSDLTTLLHDSSSSDDDDSSDGKLVVVRGQVQSKSSVNGNWMSLKDDVLVSPSSGDRAVVVQQTQAYLYNEWRGLFRWTYDLHSLFARSWKEQESSSLRTVPFILIEGGYWPRSGYVVVNLSDSVHPIPLTTVYHQLRPVQASPYTFLQAMFGHEYPVGLLDEEKILPLGKEITAVGICRSQDGVPEIKSCKDLPYFLSDMTKDQMVGNLAFRTKILLWSGIFLGTLSFGILGYAITRNWCRWKEWRHQRQRIREQRDEATVENSADNESGDAPDGELCVICLMRRRRSAFVPCGHLVCCATCAMSVERDSNPKCPVCRQTIRTSIRIYAS
ncbi:E3 Ubiquitin ligase family protein [Tasmannia lanceolata]|uniref:E3 Ubiquitin ligase family protein n=1 Tax=Tasmannia lanceolata TaxID=3420 RepID=UPI0040638A9B